MRKNNDFLVEIQTEELPPNALLRLATSFLQEITTRLTKAELTFDDAQFFATPRRLAVFVKKLSAQQSDNMIERKGPAMNAAFDHAGKPTPACIGFARSCGVEPSQLITIKNPQGEWVGYKQKVTGKSVQELLPSIVQQALSALPIPKRMRWGNHQVEFVRPVHSVILLYGKDIISAEILNCSVNRKTCGHRFLSKGEVSIGNASAYLKTLEKKFVIADFNQRKEKICDETNRLVKKLLGDNARALINETLLEEVTGLVEWPIALVGGFEQRFLTIPSDVLISAMQDHQRYFPIVDIAGKLLPHFVAISNIDSKNPARVTAGNERVLRARLSDAAFFFETDKKQTLENRLEQLKNILFQNKLGTLYDKAKRLSVLAAVIAKEIKADSSLTERAGLLAKTDLTTLLVGEFPELQGTAGCYYARANGAPEAVATAIREHYLPRFAGDNLPETAIGCAIALADRIDNLVGAFGIHQIPTGDKDPFGLRRAALGVVRILIEKKFNLDLEKLIDITLFHYEKLDNSDVKTQLMDFIFERLRYWYIEQAIPADVFASVAALKLSNLYDIHCRIQAVAIFKKLTDADALSAANKRVSNILSKYTDAIMAREVNHNLFENEAERELAKKLADADHDIIALSSESNYSDILTRLAKLRVPVDAFFDGVLVMADDKELRENRLLLLKKLRNLFLHVADIALLQ